MLQEHINVKDYIIQYFWWGVMTLPHNINYYKLLASAVLQLALQEIPVHFMLHANTCSIMG
jgi:hypothetical protein